MNDPEIKRLLKLVVFGLGLLLLIGGYMVTKASAASADPTADDVCTMIDNNPTPDGIIAAGYALLPYSYSPTDAGRRLAAALQSMCPQHIPLLEQTYLTR